MLTITLPAGHPSPDGVVAGVQFKDGKAKVNDLGLNAAKFFKSIGATLRTPRPKPQDSES